MAVIEISGVDLETRVGTNLEFASQESNVSNRDHDQSNDNQNNVSTRMIDHQSPHETTEPPVNITANRKALLLPLQNGFNHVPLHYQSIVGDLEHSVNVDEDFQSDLRELEEIFSKLNPMAAEFVPPSMATGGYLAFNLGMHADVEDANANGYMSRRGKRRMTNRTSMAQRDEVIRRTVYVSDIDHQVTEEQLAALFQSCGQVVDCRVCGDPNSVLRFAFVEFTDEEGAHAALSLAGTMLGYYPVRVLPSKTAIAPVNPSLLPKNEDERVMCARTIYCTNIDKKVSQADLKLFFESLCGEVYRLRMLGDQYHSTRIAFVEFVMAESAIAALNCSGVVFGSLPIRVSPSKTPVRPRAPRLPVIN